MYRTGRNCQIGNCILTLVEVDSVDRSRYTVTSNQISVNTVSRSYFTLFRSYGLYGTTLDTLEATNSRASAALNTVRLCLAAVPGRDVAAVRREPRVALHRGSALLGYAQRVPRRTARVYTWSSEHRRSAGPLCTIEVEALVGALTREVQRRKLLHPHLQRLRHRPDL